MNRTTVTVSIGRSLPRGGELAARPWGNFKDRTLAIVLSEANSFNDIHFTGEGQGWYQGEAEASYTIVATIDEALLGELQARLSVLAHVFGQESVAVTAGTTTLVAAVRGRR